jgi:serine/threonine-protein kinase ULK4
MSLVKGYKQSALRAKIC